MSQVMTGRPEDIVTLSVAPCIRKGIGVEIGRGCNHGCIYCFSACSTTGATQSVVYYENCAQVLESFLQKNATEVENVHLGYVTDFFQDAQDTRVRAIQQEVLEVLAKYKVSVSCLTKGRPTDDAISVINKIGERFTLMLDVGMENVEWEPGVPTLSSRLGQVAKLDCNVGARMDPIIPGLDDWCGYTSQAMERLSAIGITDMDCSYLFMTDEVAQQVEEVFDEESLYKLYEYYAAGDEEHLNSAVAWTGHKIDLEDIRYKIDRIGLLSPDVDFRMQHFNELRAKAEAFGITARLCMCKNKSMKGTTGMCTDSRVINNRRRG